MAVGAAIAVGLIVGAVLSLYIISQTPQAGMDAAGLDDFTSTQCAEGSVVPVIFGKVKIAGNILWYGDLRTEEIKEDGLSFLGMKITDDVVTGYEYYLDIWQSICMGQVDIDSVFIQDDPMTLANFYARCESGYTYNDGTGPEHPRTYIDGKPYVTALRGFPTGVAHFFANKFFVGENVTSLPTIHFVVEKTSNVPINYPNLSNGTNPAAVIYELLIMGGAAAAEIDEPSFNTAANYWSGKEYGLNLVLDSQREVRDHIQDIFSLVDGCLTQDDETGHYVLYAYKDDGSETPIATIDTEDFISFKFSRNDWSDTFNYFKGTYSDELQGFTKRTIRCMNPANEGLLGYKRPKSVDLRAYRDVASASKRLWEIMKRESYPGASIEFKTNLEFELIQEGRLVTINNTDYGISSAEFRIIEKGLGDIDDNELNFTAVQDVAGLMDDYYDIGGNPQGVDLDLDVKVPYKQDAFEMPFTDDGHDPTWVFLLARQGNEVGAKLMVSVDGGSNYYYHKTISSFAQYGTLNGTYEAGYEIDDEIGILYTPYREDPVFETISRAQLFNLTRFAIIDSEIMAFQTVTPEGVGSDIRLTGILRGLFNTTIAEHANGSDIWLFNPGSNMTNTIAVSSFYWKPLPFIGTEVIPLATASANAETSTDKAATPYPVTRIEAVRSGTTVTCTWWPTPQDNLGAAWVSGASEDDETPLYDGDFYFEDHYNGANDQYVSGTSVVVTTGAGTQIMKVRARVAGKLGPQITVTVLAADGTYIGPDA